MKFCKQNNTLGQHKCLEYLKHRGVAICEVELWADNVIKVIDDTERSRVVVIEENGSIVHEYEIKFLNKEDLDDVQ